MQTPQAKPIEPLFTRGQSATRQAEALRLRNAATRVLVVDDFLTMRNTVRGLLKDLGCINIDEATDGEIALQKINAGKYDLVILDNQMPKMHGISVLERIRASAATKDLAVVMATADNDRALVMKAGQLGVNDFVVKPFSPAHFTQRVGAVLANLKRRKVLVDEPGDSWDEVAEVAPVENDAKEVAAAA